MRTSCECPTIALLQSEQAPIEPSERLCHSIRCTMYRPGSSRFMFAGVALWKQQGVANAHEAAASVLDKLADQLPTLSRALDSEPEQPSAADQRARTSPVSGLLSSLLTETLHLQAPQALTQMPHILFVPLLWQR